MPAGKAQSDLECDERTTNSGERFFDNIRLFLAFKKGAGQNTMREEFLLYSLIEMQRRLYCRHEAPKPVDAPQVHIRFEAQIQGY